MAKQKIPTNGIPILRVNKGDSLKTIYAKARKAFTAADLAKYAVDEECVPAEDVIASMEATQREFAAKQTAAKKRKKA